jgi:hypothetical protein
MKLEVAGSSGMLLPVYQTNVFQKTIILIFTAIRTSDLTWMTQLF